MFTALILVLVAPATAWESASTQARSPDGTVVITGVDSYSRHTHGGAPAQLGTADFELTWAGTGQLALSVTRVSFLRGHSCDEPPKKPASEPAFGGLFVSGMPQSAPSLSLAPATTTTVSVG